MTKDEMIHAQAAFERGIRYLIECTPCDMPFGASEIQLIRKALREAEQSTSDPDNAPTHNTTTR